MSSRGQALIETVLLTPIVLMILIVTVLFGQWFLVRQKLIIATREAALLYSSGRMKPAEVERCVKRYIARSRPLMDPNGIQVQAGRLSGWEARLFRLDLIIVRYRCPTRLGRYFSRDMEEKCIIKHAPHYGFPYQTLYGPAVPW